MFAYNYFDVDFVEAAHGRAPAMATGVKRVHLMAGIASRSDSKAVEAFYKSVATAAEHGADLSRHSSRPVNPQLLLAADDVICMTRGHLHALARYTGSAPAARLLCGEEDVDDPIGAGPEVYRACAGTIRAHLERFLSEWVGA